MPNRRPISSLRSLSCLAVALCIPLAVSAAAPASAAVTIGQTGVPTGTCGEGDPTVQATSAGGPSYSVPAGGGVITSWSQLGSTVSPGQAKLIIWRPTSNATDFRVVGKSEVQTFVAGMLLSFPTRIPVQGGDLLGIRAGATSTVCFFVGAPGDSIRFRNDLATDPEPATGSTQTLPSMLSNTRTNISAVVEPDADADGFGDETQDECSTDASTQGPCPKDTDPPETTITKTPANKTKKPKAKYKFSSSEPNSTFECKLKGKGLKKAVRHFRGCTSPRKYKHLDDGKFKFQVRATDAAGNVDPTPAKDKFKVVR